MWRLWWAAALLLLTVTPVQAAYEGGDGKGGGGGGFTCPDAAVWKRMWTDICWDCIYPIYVGGVSMKSGEVPAGAWAANNPICSCPDENGIPEFGVPMGMWEPARLVEIVRTPWCSPVLGGIRIANAGSGGPAGETLRQMGNRGAGGGVESMATYQAHYFAFPLLQILELVTWADGCVGGGFTNMDMMNVTELDPIWQEDELALLENPEAAVFGNIVAQAACTADAAAAAIGFGEGTVGDWLFWCAGSWGPLYPFTGHVNWQNSPPETTSLLAVRKLASQHRRGLARDTMGKDAACEMPMDLFITKDQYKMSQYFPIPEATGGSGPSEDNKSSSDSGRESQAHAGQNIGAEQVNSSIGSLPVGGSGFFDGAHRIGTEAIFWGEWRNLPGAAEDYVHLIWRWNDCCMR